MCVDACPPATHPRAARITFEIAGSGPAKGIALHQGGRDFPARRIE
jgi:hypothetical protein